MIEMDVQEIDVQEIMEQIRENVTRRRRKQVGMSSKCSEDESIE